MLLAEDLPSFLWPLLGITILGAVLVIRRVFQRAGSPVEEPEQTIEGGEAASSQLGKRIAGLEVRLHDFSREVESRLETRALQLDQLVAEADREIGRLQRLLKPASEEPSRRNPDVMRFSPKDASDPAAAETQHPTGSVSQSNSANPERIVWHLHDAGFSVPEIAHIVGRSPEDIQSWLRAA